MRFFLDVSYKGSGYHGWQIQKNAVSVQEVLNKALTTLLQVKTECVGSGRTDAGVHATQQIAHFDAALQIDLSDFQHKLNVLLPFDIAVNNIHQVKPEAHARFDATQRTYHYLIHTKKDPFLFGYSYFYGQTLDSKLINKALDIIKNNKDFRSFSKVKTDVNTFECDIFDISWETYNEGHRFVVSADRFLRGMVRAFVGTLIDLGQAKTSLEDLKLILKSGNRSMAGRAVPPEGLYLHRIDYPADIFIE